MLSSKVGVFKGLYTIKDMMLSTQERTLLIGGGRGRKKNLGISFLLKFLD